MCARSKMESCRVVRGWMQKKAFFPRTRKGPQGLLPEQEDCSLHRLPSQAGAGEEGEE